LGTEGPGFLRRALNRGPWKLGGGEATVNATGWNAAGGYGVVWVPSMRMVVNLDDFDKSRWINLTGASGHAYSAHYVDQTDKWAKGELLPWAYSSEAVDENTEDTLTLEPCPGPARSGRHAPARGGRFSVPVARAAPSSLRASRPPLSPTGPSARTTLPGPARPGPARPGSAWLGPARLGPASAEAPYPRRGHRRPYGP